MQTADNVAKWFLVNNRARAMSTDAEFITNLKLQKLLYYAQGMHLGFYGKKMFEEPIHAWSYGPVVESVYDKYKHFGYYGISEFDPYIQNFTVEEEDTLKFVDNAFGQFSAWKLVDMTHSETPWKSTARGKIISVNKIKAFFKKTYVA